MENNADLLVFSVYVNKSRIYNNLLVPHMPEGQKTYNLKWIEF